MVARIQTAPDVVAAAHGQLPLAGLRETAWFRKTPALPRTPDGPEIRLISRDYLRVMGIAVVAGLTPLDPATFVVVSVAFGAIAMLAAYLPARRATKVEPLEALRNP